MKANFVCPACKATVTAPASLQGEAYPCPKCRAAVESWPAPINPPAPAPASAPTSVRVMPPPVEQAVWHYSANGAKRGPVTTTQLKSLVESGVLRTNDLLWREGMPAWVEAGTVPELFPAGAQVKPPPAPAPVAVQPPPVPVAVQPVPQPAEDDYDDRDRRAPRDERQAIQVNVHQVVERDEEERRPRRRRREGFRCPYCGSTEPPIVRRQVSGAGWAVFVILLIFTIVFCFLGLFIQEDVRYCRDCGAKLSP
ncbi:MAG: LITAF-like zinc ribbon domain-containing protein [Planctomycetes bacterium]|nr:LITAF-like zinc ribbon domain-containing protein [Planctomycetota bacterium]